MGIGNIGWTEFLVILALALIFFGPRRLPGIANAIGKSLREFQKALNEVKSEITEAGRESDLRTGSRPGGSLLPSPAELFKPAAESPATTEESAPASQEAGAAEPGYEPGEAAYDATEESPPAANDGPDPKESSGADA